VTFASKRLFTPPFFLGGAHFLQKMSLISLIVLTPKKDRPWAEPRHLSHKAWISSVRFELGVARRKQELIRRWDSGRELFLRDIVHVEASPYAHWTDFLISTINIYARPKWTLIGAPSRPCRERNQNFDRISNFMESVLRRIAPNSVVCRSVCRSVSLSH